MDKRHLTVLSWMVTALLSSQSLNQARWEPFVQSRAEQANSYQRRWNRFCQNGRVAVEKIYIPLILKAIETWKEKGESLLAGCGIPIAWCIVKANEPGSGQPYWQKLIRQLKEAVGSISLTR